MINDQLLADDLEFKRGGEHPTYWYPQKGEGWFLLSVCGVAPDASGFGVRSTQFVMLWARKKPETRAA